MSEDNGIISGRKDSHDPPQFIITGTARSLLGSIEKILAELISRSELRLSDDDFYNSFLTLLDLYDSFQHEVITSSGISIVCRAGCSHCCCHWVEDVTCIEAAVISRYIAQHHPGIIDSVISSFLEDKEVFDSLHVLVDDKIAEDASHMNDIPDSFELLLSCFYQLERPCALLDDNGSCIVYPVRPLTCRDFMNLRDPLACLPDRINEEVEATLIMYLSDTVTEHLGALHRRFEDGSDDMSLRSLLIRFLETGIESH